MYKVMVWSGVHIMARMKWNIVLVKVVKKTFKIVLKVQSDQLVMIEIGHLVGLYVRQIVEAKTLPPRVTLWHVLLRGGAIVQRIIQTQQTREQARVADASCHKCRHNFVDHRKVGIVIVNNVFDNHPNDGQVGCK